MRGVSQCNREASITNRPWPTGGCCVTGKKMPYTMFTNTIDAVDSGLLRSYRDMSVELLCPSVSPSSSRARGPRRLATHGRRVWQFFLRFNGPCR